MMISLCTFALLSLIINFNNYCANYKFTGCKFLKMPRLRNTIFWTSSPAKYMHDREYRFAAI